MRRRDEDQALKQPLLDDSEPKRTDDDDDERTRLIDRLPIWARVAVPFLLGCSAALNAIVLLPQTSFITVRSSIPFVLANGSYGLRHTLETLHKAELWLIYWVLVVFSVCLPPVKLVAACVLLGKPLSVRTRGAWLAVLGHLGRWSLVDIYFTLLLLLLLLRAELQLPIVGSIEVAGAKVESGLYIFHAAIICSMVAVQILQERNALLAPPPWAQRAYPRSRRPLLCDAGWRGAAVLATAAAAVVAHWKATHSIA